MKYKNAAEILPEELLREIQGYIEGDVLYIPKVTPKKQWGMKSGSRLYYEERNLEMKALFQAGISIAQLEQKYGLACSTIKKILYR